MTALTYNNAKQCFAIYISDKIKKHTKEEDMPHLGSCLSLGKGDMIT